ncbi:MAG: pyridoxamine 5'-phosphate oxidase [Acidimicrobiia bacterium]|nr:pyridoxamine 5'-phosphate oxidase [Acidimicrobiia bacterium]
MLSVMSRRDQIKMTESEAMAFLRAGRDLQVASINDDGTPHLVTLWYEFVGSDLCFLTFGRSQKVMNLRRDPRMTALVATGEKYEELRGVSIAGRAEIDDSPDEVILVNELVYAKHWGVIESETMRDEIKAMSAKRVVIRIKVDSMVTWDHSKLGGGY